MAQTMNLNQQDVQTLLVLAERCVKSGQITVEEMPPVYTAIMAAKKYLTDTQPKPEAASDQPGGTAAKQKK